MKSFPYSSCYQYFDFKKPHTGKLYGQLMIITAVNDNRRDDILFACDDLLDRKDMSDESIALFKIRGFKLRIGFQIRALNLYCRRSHNVALLHILAKLLMVQNSYQTQMLQKLYLCLTKFVNSRVDQILRVSSSDNWR